MSFELPKDFELKKISVLIPVYGVEKYIERCARSVFSQTYRNLEIIFVDDCTPDHSIDVVRRVLEDYPERKPQVKIIKHDHNRGLAAARNTAVDNATGDFVMHVDSDDWIEKNSIELLVSMQEETEADIVSGDAITEGEEKQYVLKIPSISEPHKMIMEYLSSDNGHQLCGRLVLRRLYANIDGPREGVDNGEDTQTVPQLLYYAKRLANVSKPLYHYYMNPASLTHSKRKINARFEIQLIESSLAVRNFFHGKDTELERQADWYLAHRIWGTLSTCAGVDRKVFDKAHTFISNVTDKDHFSAIAGGRLKARIMLSWYGMRAWKRMAKLIHG